MTCDRVYLFRETGFHGTLEITSTDDGTPIDCTGCSARLQIRTEPNSPDGALVDISTSPASGANSYLSWLSDSGGVLQIVIDEVLTKDIAKFPRIASKGYTQDYYCDVIIRESDGTPKMDPIDIPLTFTETATVTA